MISFHWPNCLLKPLLCKGTTLHIFPSSPFHMFTLKSTVPSPPLGSEQLLSCTLRVKYLHKLFAMFLCERFFSLSPFINKFINLFNYLYSYENTFILQFAFMNLRLLTLFQFKLNIGTHSFGFCSHWTNFPIIADVHECVCLGTSLLFVIIRGYGLISCTACLFPRISHFYWEPWFFLLENDI